MKIWVGAPEYPGRSEQPVSQAIDIWSLACVFSLAATWIVLDNQGIRQFHEVRQRATRQHNQARRNDISYCSQTIEIPEGDQFHDGRGALKAVTEWHKYLRTVTRNTDVITTQVLDLVDEWMLLSSPEGRINASDLCSRLDQISKSCQHEPQLSDTIKNLLGEIDEEESCQATKTRRSRYAAPESSSSGKTVT